ncbi:hypothetical protein [Flavivirga algicola]|uniref:SMI1/KNR4 family protein n=1 Tax=Flavivirga algicola TaxID=2729136 RepID=A0ABX1RYB3_9FLAO|nr:hypothetical protein [Flavivirga algicola]NMH87489.1 hypothetical protein [Flavivirga algicola]
MLKHLQSMKLYEIESLPERIENFHLSEVNNYDEYILEEPPRFFSEDEQAWIDFSVKEVKYLINAHEDMIISESKKDNKKYMPIAGIQDLIDFFAIDVSDDKCPVYYGDIEDGEFRRESSSLDDFLRYYIRKGDPEI